jgi:hypothetical protein
VPLVGETLVICPDRVLRFDRAGVPAGAVPLDMAPLGAVAAAGPLALLRPEGRDFQRSAHPRLCLSFLGRPPSDCFEPVGYERRGDQVIVPVAMAADAREIVVAWTAVSASPRAIHARAYRCELAGVGPAPAAAEAAPVERRPPPTCPPDPAPPLLMAREVTGAEYQRCVAARACTPPRAGKGRKRPALPVVNVTVKQAADYCAFAGTRLPTDEEWAAAARADCAPFPWGSSPTGGRANCIASEAGYALRPPGSTPADVVRGRYDLLGNAMEWTSDGTVRGSRYCSEPLATTQPPPAAGHDPYVGFRCMSAPAKAPDGAPRQ